jgi:hypothetical protein
VIVVLTVPLGTDERDDERMDLESVADELYALAPEDFVSARDAFAKQVRNADLKKAVKALRRPTVSAHEVNRLVRERPDDVDALLALGDELRAAMTGGDGDVRALSEQRRAAVNALVDPDLSAAVRDEVTATMEAATADPQLGAAVRSGRLVKPLRYAGFGEFPDLTDAVATPVRSVAPRSKKPPATKTTKKTAAKTVKAVPEPGPDLTELRARVLELAGAADDAQRRYDVAARAVVEARALLDRAEKERAEAHRAARAAHDEAEKARRELGRLERS